METSCPNCGGRLANYRTQRQTAGQRQAILRWSICVRCQHVALQDWSMTERAGSRASDRGEPAHHARDKPQQSRRFNGQRAANRA